MNVKRKEPNPQSKSLSAHPLIHPVAAKHLLSYHRTCFVDNFLQLDKFLNADFFKLAE
jgi:hypothetical protein